MLYTVLYPIAHMGSRVEKKAELELTEAQAFNYGDAVELSKDQPQEVEEPEDTTPIEEMSVDQLKKKAMSLGIKATGSKADLLERITLHAGAEEEEPA